MKYHLNPIGFLILGFIVAVSAIAAQQKKPAIQNSNATDEAKIRKIFENHMAWTEARDWQSIREEWTEDAVFMSNHALTIIGKEDIAASFRTGFAQRAAAQLTMKMAIDIEEIKVSGEFAFDRGTYAVTTTNKDGQQRQYTSRFMEIFRKQPDGSWKIARAMNNSVPDDVRSSQKNSGHSSSIRTSVGSNEHEKSKSGTTNTVASDEAKIRDLVEHHAAWFNAGDWQSIRTEFTGDVVAMLEATPNVNGREAVAAYFRDELAQFAQAGMTVKLSVALDETQVFGDWAFARAIFSPTFTKGNQQRQAQVRFMLVFQKQPDRQWKIARFMTNIPGAGPQFPEKGPPTVTTSDSLPTVDQILDKYVQAIGGKAAIEKMTSRVSKGSVEFTAQGARGTIEISAKAPNKSVTTIDISDFGLIQQVFNGTNAWAQNPQTGLRELTGAELAFRKRDADFYREIKLKQIYPTMIVKGKATIDGKEVYVVEATPPDGGPETLYFDTQTGFLIRRDFERESPQGKITVQTYFEDYREADGIKIPFTVRNLNPFNPFTIKLDEVKHNSLIDDTKFSKPGAQP